MDVFTIEDAKQISLELRRGAAEARKALSYSHAEKLTKHADKMLQLAMVLERGDFNGINITIWPGPKTKVVQS